jgi:hypothetical protein
LPGCAAFIRALDGSSRAAIISTCSFGCWGGSWYRASSGAFVIRRYPAEHDAIARVLDGCPRQPAAANGAPANA